MYQKALQIAYKAHKDQTRRDSNIPYIVHPIRVSGYFSGDFQRTIAVLHDVIEDTDVTLSELRIYFPSEVIHVLELLSRKDDEIYTNYIKRLSESRIARDIKIADIVDNLSDCTSPEPQGMVNRYKKALEILINLST